MADGRASLTQRIDQWLWFSRLAKSRTLAQALIERNKVRLNRERVEKPSQTVKPGDVLTVSMGPHVRIFEVLAIGVRRGPAPEAAALYREREGGTVQAPRARSAKPAEAAVPEPASPQAVRDEGAGRPTKRDRRQIERLKTRFDTH